MWNWLKSPKTQPVVDAADQEKNETDRSAEEAPKQKIIVITGTSGSGRKKTAQQLSAALGIPERDGEHYHFISDAVFSEMAAKQAFFQTVRLVRGSYGIVKAELLQALEERQAAIVVVNREGARTFREHFGNGAIRVFLYVTKEDIRQRLERESAPPEILEEYLRTYMDDVVYKKESEFLLQNIQPASTVEKIKAFLQDKL
jgi:guanylate kinase